MLFGVDGATIWWRQGTRQLTRHRAATTMLAGSAAVSAAFFAVVLMVYLLMQDHFPAGAAQAHTFSTLGIQKDSRRYGAFGLEHLDALSRFSSRRLRFYGANIGSTYELAGAGQSRRVPVGFASDNLLGGLGVELVKGNWPAARQAALSSSLARQLYGSPQSALGRSIKLGAADLVVSAVFSSEFEGLQPRWEGADPTEVWVPASDLFAVSGFGTMLPEAIQRKAPLFHLYVRDTDGLTATQLSARVSFAMRSAGLSTDKWEARAGLFQGLAERDTMLHLLAPASIALAGMVLAVLLSLVAHEARTIDPRVASIALRRQLGGGWARIALQEAVTAFPLAISFGVLALVATAAAATMLKGEALDLLGASKQLGWRSLGILLVPVLTLAMLPVLSRLPFLLLARSTTKSQQSHARLSRFMFGLAVACGVPAAALLLALARTSLPILAEVGGDSAQTIYLNQDRLRSSEPLPARASVEALATSLRHQGLAADAATSAPFSKCDHAIELAPAQSVRPSYVQAVLVGTGNTTLGLLGIRIVSGRAPTSGEALVTESLAKAMGGLDQPGARLFARTGESFRISGVVRDQMFDAPSMDAPLRVFAPRIDTGCPYFLVLKTVDAGQVAQATAAFESAFGPARVSYRAQLAHRRLYASVLLGRAVVISAVTVLLIALYLVSEALRSYLVASQKVFAVMFSLGATSGGLIQQTVRRIWLPGLVGAGLGLALLYVLWMSLPRTGNLVPGDTLKAFALVLIPILTAQGVLIAWFQHRQSSQNIAAILKENG
jgi:hypothetical protein